MEAERIEPDALVAAARAQLDVDLPEQCIAGVIEALAAIADHARIVDGAA